MLPAPSSHHAPPQFGPRCNAHPRVVAIGGGTGLPNVLRGLRPLLFGPADRPQHPAARERLVAVVTTSDDGGSSGKLREEFKMIPPGDIRNCLTALSDNAELIADIFQYRFDAGEGLSGHALGNLVLTALMDVTHDFARAVELAARVVGARGTVLPVTSEMLTLVAAFEDGRVLTGETAIARAGGRIARVALLPERPRCNPAVCEAVRRADVIVAGPGSLYTSILPPLLVPDVSAAIRESGATRIFVANLMTEPGETDGFDVLQHVLTIERHLGVQLFDYVIYNTGPVPEAVAARYAANGAVPLLTGPAELSALERSGITPIGVPLASEHPAGKIRHHPERLAGIIAALGQGKLAGWRRAEAGGF